MKPSKSGSSPRRTLVEHLVELGQHVLHPSHVLGRHRLDGPGHAVDVRVEHLLAEPLDQLVEPPLGLGRGEVVVLELAHHAREVRGQHLQLHVALVGGALRRLGPARVAAGAGVANLPVDLGPLGVDDLAQLLGDLVVDATEVEPVEPLLALAAQAVEQVADPLDHLALPVAEPRLQEPPERGVEVAVVQQVVGHLLEHGVGVEVEADLGAVPAAVAELGARHCSATVPVTVKECVRAA